MIQLQYSIINYSRKSARKKREYADALGVDVTEIIEVQRGEETVAKVFRVYADRKRSA